MIKIDDAVLKEIKLEAEQGLSISVANKNTGLSVRFGRILDLLASLPPQQKDVQAALDALEIFNKAPRKDSYPNGQDVALTRWQQGQICTALMQCQGWQPIETAPRDGTEVVLAIILNWDDEAKENNEPRVGTGFYVCGAYWYDGSYWRSRIANFLKEPTHWMPLQTPPETTEEA